MSESTKCLNCSFAVTGIVPNYCCKKCKENPNQHGKLCKQQTPTETEEEKSSAFAKGDRTGASRCDWYNIASSEDEISTEKESISASKRKKAKKGSETQAKPSKSSSSTQVNGQTEIQTAQSPQPTISAHIHPVVPLQPWEADKLQSMAQQVLTALEEDRYDKDYGAILLNHLGNWQGSEQWAQTEGAILSSLVNADDAQSRRELRGWIENSVLCSLREIQKEVNRGALASLIDEPVSVSSSGGASNSQANERRIQDQKEDDELMGSWEVVETTRLVRSASGSSWVHIF